MKTLYCISFFVLTLLSSVTAQVTTTLNQTFSSMGATAIRLDVATSDITIRSTKGSRVIVESVVKLSTSNDRLLEFAVQSGRYKLTPSYHKAKDLLCLQRARPASALVIKGEEITETIRYTIYLPEVVNYAKKAAHPIVEG